jgi:hypothetical protein
VQPHHVKHEMEAFDVRQFLHKRAHAETEAVAVTQPLTLAYWTKRSINEGGGFVFGDTSGERDIFDRRADGISLFCITQHTQRRNPNAHTPTTTTTTTIGLATYAAPALPADLNAGWPHAFVRKPRGAASPVDTILQAAAAAEAAEATAAGGGGAAGGMAQRWRRASVVTYRNNLNKVLMTPLNLRDAWAVDALYVPPAPAGGEGGEEGLLLLDINADGRSDPTPGSQPDRMTYWGYKFEALCTGMRVVFLRCVWGGSVAQFSCGHATH